MVEESSSASGTKAVSLGRTRLQRVKARNTSGSTSNASGSTSLTITCSQSAKECKISGSQSAKEPAVEVSQNNIKPTKKRKVSESTIHQRRHSKSYSKCSKDILQNNAATSLIPSIMDIDSVHGGRDKEGGDEGATAKGGDEGVAPVLSTEPVLSTGTDVDAIIEQIADGTYDVFTPQCSEDILQNTADASLIPSVMDIESVHGGKNNKCTDEAAADIVGLVKGSCDEATTNEHAGCDGNSVKSPCNEERVECSALDQVRSTGMDVVAIMEKIADETYPILTPQCSQDNKQNSGAVSSMLSTMDIESVHDGQNIKCTDQYAPIGVVILKGPFCDEERAECSPDETDLTASRDIDSIIRKINDGTYAIFTPQSSQNIVQNSVLALSQGSGTDVVTGGTYVEAILCDIEHGNIILDSAEEEQYISISNLNAPSGPKERQPESTGLATLSDICMQESEANLQGKERVLIEKVPLIVHEIIEKIQQKRKLLYSRKRKRKSLNSCPNFSLLTQSTQSSDNIADHATSNISASVAYVPAEHSVAADMEKNDS